MEYKERKKTIKTVFQLTLAAVKIAKAVNPNSKEKEKIKRIEKLFKHALFQIGKVRNELQLELAIKNINAEIIKAETPQPKPQFLMGGVLQRNFCSPIFIDAEPQSLPETEAQFNRRMLLANELEKAFKSNRHKLIIKDADEFCKQQFMNIGNTKNCKSEIIKSLKGGKKNNFKKDD